MNKIEKQKINKYGFSKYFSNIQKFFKIERKIHDFNKITAEKFLRTFKKKNSKNCKKVSIQAKINYFVLIFYVKKFINILKSMSYIKKMKNLKDYHYKIISDKCYFYSSEKNNKNKFVIINNPFIMVKINNLIFYLFFLIK